jgi:pimeloyl-ACP methyl ester carboxylesterase
MAPGATAKGRSPLNARVTSSDGVAVALHELAGHAGLPPLLISHATGFHGHAYAPLARALGDRFHCFALDHRGHGHTDAPPSWRDGTAVDWAAYGDDAAAAADAVAPGGGLTGFGHSMGAATLLMAAARDRRRFSKLVLFEPIAGPFDRPFDPDTVPLVVGARRRRRRFASFDEAYANFAAKPPMALMTADSLRQYVDHGFRPTPQGDVELRCSPETEAATFAASRHNGVWAMLPDIDVATTVVTGAVEEDEPSAVAALIAERLPNGRLVSLPHQTHFGPFSHPEEVAALI